MARSTNDFLQSLQKSITTYYTATYSSDTDLYPILQMYGAELASGSIALETVRNNVFIITCENSKLFNNFGTFFNQAKYFNQDYNEDKYSQETVKWSKSGSALHRWYTETSNIDFIKASQISFPYEMKAGFPSDTDILGLPLQYATSFKGRLFISAVVRELEPYTNEDAIALGNQVAIISNPRRNIRVIAWNPVTDTWKSHEELNMMYASDERVFPIFGFESYYPYTGRSVYNDQRIGWYDMTLWTGPPPTGQQGGSGPQPIPANIPRVQFEEYTEPYDFNTGESSGSFTITIMYADPDARDNGEFSFTKNAVNFHDKMYTGFAIKEDDYSSTSLWQDALPMLTPDTIYRWPMCIEYNPVTQTHTEAGLSNLSGLNAGTIVPYPNTINGPGITWGQVFNGSSIIKDLIEYSSHIYAANDNGVYRSNIRGEAWTRVLNTTDMEAFAISGSSLLALRPVTGVTLYRSPNGTSWTAAALASTIGKCHIALTFTGSSGTHTYVGAESPCRISRTSYLKDSTYTVWTSLQDFDQTRVQALADFNSNIYAAVVNDSPTRSRLYRSASGDSGSFSQVFAEPYDRRIECLFSDANNLYIGTLNDTGSSRIYRTSSGASGSYTAVAEFVHSVRDLTYASGSFWAAVGDSSGGGEFWYSSNGNSGSWTLHTSVPGTIDSYSYTYSITPSGSSDTYISVGAAIFRTPAGAGIQWIGNYDVDNIFVFDNKLWMDIIGTGTGDAIGTDFRYLANYNTISWAIGKTSPAQNNSDIVRKYVVFKDELYAAVNDEVRKYNNSTDTWSTIQSFAGLSVVTLHVYKNKLFASVTYGSIYVFDEDANEFILFQQLDATSDKETIRAFVNFSTSPVSMYGWYNNNNWYSSSYQSITDFAYYWPGPTVEGNSAQNVAIPSYRKQLDFMFEAAVHGSTLKGIIRAANAFTLINPDIRESYNVPQWKLKAEDYDVTQLSTNTWQFSSAPNWRPNEFAGAHVTLISGSLPQNKIAAGYLILVNSNDTVTVGAIEDKHLLFDLTRPS